MLDSLFRDHTQPHIVLANGVGWGNLGDDAIALAIIYQLSAQAGNPSISLMGGPFTNQLIETRPQLKELAPPGALRRIVGSLRLLRAHSVVLGGGGLMQDRLPNYYRPYYRAMQAAKLSRVPLAVTSIGIYPPQTTKFRDALCQIVAYASHFTVRDAASAIAVSNATGCSPPPIVPDAAFSFVPPAARIEVDRSKPVIGVVIRPWWHLPEMWDVPAPSQFDHLLTSIATALIRLHSESDCDFLFIPMQLGTADDDLAVAKDLAHRLGPDVKVRIASIDTVDSVVEAIQSCDALLGMRLHSLILATILGVPTVAIAYDPKVSALMERVGRSEYVLDVERVGDDHVLTLLKKALAEGLSARTRTLVANLHAASRSELRRVTEITRFIPTSQYRHDNGT